MGCDVDISVLLAEVHAEALGHAVQGAPIDAQHLRRTRPRIERLLSLLAHRYGARKSRYRGRRKAALQAAWTAALVNLNPIGARLAAEAI